MIETMWVKRNAIKISIALIIISALTLAVGWFATIYLHQRIVIERLTQRYIDGTTATCEAQLREAGDAWVAIGRCNEAIGRCTAELAAMAGMCGRDP